MAKQFKLALFGLKGNRFEFELDPLYVGLFGLRFLLELLNTVYVPWNGG